MSKKGEIMTPEMTAPPQKEWWWKTDTMAPCAAYFAFGMIHMITGSTNPVTGLMMSCVSSIVDVATGIFTNYSEEPEDKYFRFTASTVIPLTLGMCLGLPLHTAVMMSLINLGLRVLLYEHLFEKKRGLIGESV